MPGRNHNLRDDDDATIRVARPPPKPTSRLLLPMFGLAILLACGFAVWMVSRPPLPAANVHTGLDAPLADEAAILAARGPDMLVFRFRDATSVLVLSFPSLRQQGAMLDRVAAFVEKAGLPRDRVLADAELDAAIRRSGDTPETYYYGHDYRVGDIARFFATADHDGIMLQPEEVRLRELLAQAGMLSPNAVGAVISIPPEVQSEHIDMTSRATILHHELSHGVFFTNPVYASYSAAFWQTELNDAQRAGFRRFLGTEGYDTTNEDLMLNEAQAYLVHTPDNRYFLPDRVGLSVQQAATLRETFIRGMPDGWLKEAAKAAKPSLD